MPPSDVSLRFGVCCGLEQAADVLEAGFDYVEFPAYKALVLEKVPPADVRRLGGEATYLFTPPGLRLDSASKELAAYAEMIIALAAEAGVEVMVIGGGGARRAAPGQDLRLAETSFADACGLLARIGLQVGVTVAPESLKRAETNVGNSLSRLVAELAAREVSFTADSHHVLNDWKDEGNELPAPEEFFSREIPTSPVHVHLSTLGRSWQVGDGTLDGFVRRLSGVGYSGRVSLECEWRDWKRELPEALHQVRRLFGQP